MKIIKKIKKFISFIDEKIDLKKFIKFGITGVLNTAVDFAVYSFCLEILKFDVIMAQPIGQGAAIINSYLFNKYWTFAKSKNHNKNNKSSKTNKTEIFKFLLVNGGSVAINILGVYFFHDILEINEYLCKIPIACITIAINYFGNKLFVFK